MSKSQMILAVMLMAAISAIAQESPTVLLLSSDKPIIYCNDNGARFKNVHPGAIILKNNEVKIPKKGTAMFYGDGVFKQLTAGKYRLSEVMASGENARSLGIDNTLGNYLAAAISLAKEANGASPNWASLISPQTGGDGWGVTDPKKSGDGWGVTDPKKSGDGWGVTDPKKSGDGWGVTDPKKSGDGWGVTDPKKSGDGWGGKGQRIHLIMPFGIVLPDGKTRFSWSKPANAGPYMFKIKDAKDAVVYEATVSDTFAEVDLTKATFAQGAHFIWQVRTIPEGAVLESNVLEFSISNSESRKAALQPLERSKMYPVGDPALRGVMEAIVLERADWFQAASLTYESLKSKYPNNNLVRMMYATFWMRYGLTPMAHAAVRK